MSFGRACARRCARATQFLSKKCRSGDGPLATLYPISSARNLNVRPPAPEANPLPLDQNYIMWKANVIVVQNKKQKQDYFTEFFYLVFQYF